MDSDDREHQKELKRIGLNAQACEREKDREFREKSSRIQRNHQIELADRREELASRRERDRSASLVQLELLKHDPALLANLTADIAERRSIEVQAFQMETEVATSQEIRRIEAAGDDARRMLKHETKCHLIKMAFESALKIKEIKASQEAESALKCKEMELAHKLAVELAQIQSQPSTAEPTVDEMIHQAERDLLLSPRADLETSLELPESKEQS